MNSKRNFIEVTKTAQYFTLGEISAATTTVWIVCHGYGQLPEYFIKKFDGIADKNTFIVSPEGLSKFYLEGFSGKVGASWMTSNNRKNEIKDHTAYLEKLYRQIDNQINQPYKLILFGFSQGAATIGRWLLEYQPPVDQLILWSGFPPANNTETPLEALKKINCPVKFVYGTNDPLLQPAHLQLIKEVGATMKNIDIISFDGQHKIDKTILSGLTIS